jgi:hypothetical protein
VAGRPAGEQRGDGWCGDGRRRAGRAADGEGDGRRAGRAAAHAGAGAGGGAGAGELGWRRGGRRRRSRRRRHGVFCSGERERRETTEKKGPNSFEKRYFRRLGEGRRK